MEFLGLSRMVTLSESTRLVERGSRSCCELCCADKREKEATQALVGSVFN